MLTTFQDLSSLHGPCLPYKTFWRNKSKTPVQIYIQTYCMPLCSLYVLLLPSQFLCFFFFSISLLANNMNNYRDAYGPCCYFHPKEVIVGVCALCLRERLLALASKQGHRPISKDTNKSFWVLRRRPAISLPKVFALGSFLQRLESRRNRPDDGSDEGSIASIEGITPNLIYSFYNCLLMILYYMIITKMHLILQRAVIC